MDFPGIEELGLAKRLYKYTAPEYAENIVKYGDIWIGTLHDYRREEQLGDAVGDRDEGRLTRTLALKHYDSTGNHPDDRFVRGMLSGVIGGISLDNVQAENINFRQNINFSDCYIYSTTKSRNYNDKKLRSFGNACILIHNPKLFFGVITGALMEKTLGYSPWYPVVYGNRESHYRNSSPTDAAFTKPRSYQWQGEVRTVWPPRPDSYSLVPHLIRVPEVKNACSICT